MDASNNGPTLWSLDLSWSIYLWRIDPSGVLCTGYVGSSFRGLGWIAQVLAEGLLGMVIVPTLDMDEATPSNSLRKCFVQTFCFEPLCCND
jgi:hypothetical protein